MFGTRARVHVASMRSLMFSCLVLACGSTQALAQRTEPVGRTLGDIGRTSQTDTGATRDGRPGVRTEGTPSGVTIARQLTASGQFSSGRQAGGLQLRAVATWESGLRLLAAVKGQAIHTSSATRNQLQLDVEVDPPLGTDRAALAIGATFSKRFSVSTSQEYFAALDFTPFSAARNAVLRSLSFGGVGYYNRADADGTGGVSSGATPGVTSSFAPREGTSLAAEYDFNSDFNGEDYFSARLIQRLPFARYAPLLIVGGGKHNLYSVALRLSL